ncbi:transposase [Actinocrinis puniceicyclus]|uniref:Transposase n=1 Tax=Actinocrinis puniceicyclus TaxID=977794 RepID=A0A8J7WSP8_9ACTN|nr:transposase [Actinocrinis puniceicyclus]MBS2965772.1 transposase [Actinocrinis puniceicyclus]
MCAVGCVGFSLDDFAIDTATGTVTRPAGHSAALSAPGGHYRQRRAAFTGPAARRRWRPPVERAVAWIVAHGNRRVRYYGTIKNNARLHTRAVALNLRTLINLGLRRTDGHGSIAATPAN